MQWFSGFAITVLCIIFITSVCDALMPDGNLSKYVRMVLGLVVMVTVVGAALGVTQIDFDAVFELEDAPLLDRQNAALEYNRQITQDFQENLERSAEDYISRNFGVRAEVEATLEADEEENVKSILGLDVTLEAQQADAFAIGRELANNYGLSGAQVTVRGSD